MEKLKLILKKSLADGATQAILRVGQEPQMVVQHERTIPLKEFGTVDATWLESLYKGLFPREGLALRAEQPVRSQFNIVNVGKVHAIADPHSPKSLYLFFPPKGEFLSQDFWMNLSAPAKQGSAPKAMPQAEFKAPPVEVRAPTEAPPDAATVVSQVNPAIAASMVSKAVRPEATSTQSPKEHTVLSPSGVTLPEDVLKNKNALAILISDDAQLSSQAKEIGDSLQLFLMTLHDIQMFSSILDTVTPHLIFLDERISKFQDYLKKIYDLNLEKRCHMTVVLISANYRAEDTKTTFALSVDGIVSVSSLQNLSTLSKSYDDQRKSLFKAWLELVSKV
jgi:hypothetical protein